MFKKSDKTILLIDDEDIILDSMEIFLQSEDFQNIIKFNRGIPAIEYVNKNKVDLIFLDLSLPDINGLEMLIKLNQENPQIPVIMVTGSDDVESVIACMKNGASDFLVKPVDFERASASMKNAFEYSELNSTFHSLKKEFFVEKLENPEYFSSIITTNSTMTKLFHYSAAISKSSLPVLITGETGVGKELFAKAIHDSSNRTGAFIAMDVSSYSSENFKDALFGHIKGAFTGAGNSRAGLIKNAENGTLFLDEIGDLSLELQSILLRFIQENEYRQGGSDKLIKTNARIIFATHRDLDKLILEGLFRKDLFYRLETHSFEIPPLRKRQNDIPLLFNNFISSACNDLNKTVNIIPDNIYTRLEGYSYPGNVRELKNIAFNAVTLSNKSELLIEDITSKFKSEYDNLRIEDSPINTEDINIIEEKIAESLAGDTSFPTLDQADELLINEALLRTNNNQTKASELLGITRQALNRRLNRRLSNS